MCNPMALSQLVAQWLPSVHVGLRASFEAVPSLVSVCVDVRWPAWHRISITRQHAQLASKHLNRWLSVLILTACVSSGSLVNIYAPFFSPTSRMGTMRQRANSGARTLTRCAPFPSLMVSSVAVFCCPLLALANQVTATIRYVRVLVS